MAATEEAIDLIAKKHGLKMNSLRVRAFPFQDEVHEFIAQHKQVFVVEQNRDAQLKILLVNELELDSAKLTPILHYNGEPISALAIVTQLEHALDLKQAASVSEQAS